MLVVQEVFKAWAIRALDQKVIGCRVGSDGTPGAELSPSCPGMLWLAKQGRIGIRVNPRVGVSTVVEGRWLLALKSAAGRQSVARSVSGLRYGKRRSFNSSESRR